MKTLPLLPYLKFIFAFPILCVFTPLLEAVLLSSVTVLSCSVLYLRMNRLFSWHLAVLSQWKAHVGPWGIWGRGHPWISLFFFAFDCISSSINRRKLVVGCLCWVLCLIKKTTIWWLKQWSLLVLKPGNSKTKASANSVSDESSLSDSCMTLSSPCVHTWLKEMRVVLGFFCEDTNPFSEGSSLTT